MTNLLAQNLPDYYNIFENDKINKLNFR